MWPHLCQTNGDQRCCTSNFTHLGCGGACREPVATFPHQIQKLCDKRCTIFSRSLPIHRICNQPYVQTSLNTCCSLGQTSRAEKRAIAYEIYRGSGLVNRGRSTCKKACNLDPSCRKENSDHTDQKTRDQGHQSTRPDRTSNQVIRSMYHEEAKPVNRAPDNSQDSSNDCEKNVIKCSTDACRQLPKEQSPRRPTLFDSISTDSLQEARERGVSLITGVDAVVIKKKKQSRSRSPGGKKRSASSNKKGPKKKKSSSKSPNRKRSRSKSSKSTKGKKSQKLSKSPSSKTSSDKKLAKKSKPAKGASRKKSKSGKKSSSKERGSKRTLKKSGKSGKVKKKSSGTKSKSKPKGKQKKKGKTTKKILDADVEPASLSSEVQFQGCTWDGNVPTALDDDAARNSKVYTEPVQKYGCGCDLPSIPSTEDVVHNVSPVSLPTQSDKLHNSNNYFEMVHSQDDLGLQPLQADKGNQCNCADIASQFNDA